MNIKVDSYNQEGTDLGKYYKDYASSKTNTLTLERLLTAIGLPPQTFGSGSTEAKSYVRMLNTKELELAKKLLY
jgi:hypothetical protein